jgi:GxxExxY protein
MALYREEDTFRIIGICMEVHRNLGPGLLEIIYKDALEIEFKDNNIPYEREKEYKIIYKERLLPRKYVADFIVMDDIVLEVKSVKEFTSEHIAKTLNYMKLANSDISLLVNFQNKSLQHKRLVF